MSIYYREGFLDSNDRKKDFIIANTTEKKTRTYLDDENTPVSKKKNVHRSYSFCVDGVRYHVCKKYFLATLGVSQKAWNISFRFLSFIFIVQLKVHLEQSTGFKHLS
jgi:hypothetical protein